MTSSDDDRPTAGTAHEAILDALRAVVDPELGENIVELGMVPAIGIDAGAVSLEIALTIAGCPLRDQLRRDIDAHVAALPGVETVTISMGAMSKAERSALMDRARVRAAERQGIATISPDTRVLAVVSGKGGVGKSSITANLACALAERGLRVGVLDADIWGFSIPRLFGMDGPIEVRDKKMVPHERAIGSGLVKVISMGFLSNEDEAIMWRGLVLNRAVQHFLEDVAWGELDYLLVDMPPGTGDIQMGLTRMLARTELLIVTTPALAAQKVAGRAADMARKGHLRVAGVIENMGSFSCAHGESYAIFGKGGGVRLAEEIGVPLVASIPIDPAIAAGGDIGVPAALDDGALRPIFAALAQRLATEIAPVVAMTDCSARLLDTLEAALPAVT